MGGTASASNEATVIRRPEPLWSGFGQPASPTAVLCARPSDRGCAAGQAVDLHAEIETLVGAREIEVLIL